MNLKSITIAITTLGLIVSCSSDSSLEKVIQEDSTSIEATINTQTYSLNIENSDADWFRSVEQSGTTKKIKLFGKMTEVKLGETSFTTEGDAELTDGELIFVDDEASSLNVTFSVSSLAAKNGEEGIFNVVDHPNSTFHLTSFEKTDSTLIGSGIIQIEGIEKPVTSVLSISSENEKHSIEGKFSINTLDFPLRNEDSAKTIQKDIIDISYSLFFE